MASSEPAQPYVRVAKPSEYAEATRVLTRAFAKDPAMNWYGNVREMVDDIDNPGPTAKRTMRNLQWFQAAILRATVLVQGVVTVAVIPRAEQQDGQEQGQGAGQEGEKTVGEEEIVGVALWLPPGKTMDMGPITTVRSGLPKVMVGWGLVGVKVRPPSVLMGRDNMYVESPARTR